MLYSDSWKLSVREVNDDERGSQTRVFAAVALDDDVGYVNEVDRLCGRLSHPVGQVWRAPGG